MDQSFITLILSAVSLGVVLRLGHAQFPVVDSNHGSCTPITLPDLANPDQLNNNQGFLTDTLRSNFADNPQVRALNFHVVCEVAGITRGTVAGVSFVVDYECQGVPCTENGGNSTLETEQIQYNCSSDAIESGGVDMVYETFFFRQGVRTSNPNADFATVPAKRCGLCIDPAVGVNSDPVTHCLPCHEACNEGQMRCVGPESNQCCNWYLDDQCVATCPAPLVGNTDTFDCECSELSLEGGSVSYSDGLGVGSIAFHECGVGYFLSNPCNTTRICTPEGWSEDPLQCLALPTPEPVTIFLSPPTVPSTTCPASSLLVGVAVGLSLLTVLAFVVGVAVGAVAHQYWIKRRERKSGSYSPEKPVRPVPGDEEQALYGHLENHSVSGSIKVERNSQIQYDSLNLSKGAGTIPTFDNTAYGSVIAAQKNEYNSNTREDPTETADNPYVRDPMGKDTNNQDISTSGNVAYRSVQGGGAEVETEGDGHEVYTTIGDPEVGVAEAEMIYSEVTDPIKDNVSSDRDTRQPSLTGPKGIKVAGNISTERGNSYTTTEDFIANAAYSTSKSSLTGSLKDKEVMRNATYRSSKSSLTGSLKDEEVVIEENVAYKPTETSLDQECLYDYTTDNLSDDNSAHKTSRSSSMGSLKKADQTTEYIPFSESDYNSEGDGLIENSAYQSSTKPASNTGPLKLTENGATSGIEVTGNVAYISTSADPIDDTDLYEYTTTEAVTENLPKKARNAEIPVGDNVAYLKQTRDGAEVPVGDNVAYLKQTRDGAEIPVGDNVANPKQTRDGAEILVENNVAYLKQTRDGAAIPVGDNVAYLKQTRDGAEIAVENNVAYLKQTRDGAEIPVEDNVAYLKQTRDGAEIPVGDNVAYLKQTRDGAEIPVGDNVAYLKQTRDGAEIPVGDNVAYLKQTRDGAEIPVGDNVAYLKQTRDGAEIPVGDNVAYLKQTRDGAEIPVGDNVAYLKQTRDGAEIPVGDNVAYLKQTRDGAEIPVGDNVAYLKQTRDGAEIPVGDNVAYLKQTRDGAEIPVGDNVAYLKQTRDGAEIPVGDNVAYLKQTRDGAEIPVGDNIAYLKQTRNSINMVDSEKGMAKNRTTPLSGKKPPVKSKPRIIKQKQLQE